MSLHARNEIHVARRLWHFFGVGFIAFLYWILPRRVALITTFSVSGAMIFTDCLRLYVPRLNRFFVWIFGPFLRESERQKISGAAFMMAGITLVIVAFPRSVGLLTLMFFSVADPLASYFGIRFGKDKLIGEKSFQGSLAAFVACFVVAYGFFRATGMVQERRFIVCMLAGFVGAISELVPVGKLDDNFIFPVLNAVLLTGLFYIFGGLA